MLIDIENMKKIEQEILDRWILDLQLTINTSDNYNYVWSLIDVINNLNDGFFDVELHENELHIFGVYIDDVTEEEKEILLGESD